VKVPTRTQSAHRGVLVQKCPGCPYDSRAKPVSGHTSRGLKTIGSRARSAGAESRRSPERFRW
jgi:hypothetical protein